MQPERPPATAPGATACRTDTHARCSMPISRMPVATTRPAELKRSSTASTAVSKASWPAARNGWGNGSSSLGALAGICSVVHLCAPCKLAVQASSHPTALSPGHLLWGRAVEPAAAWLGPGRCSAWWPAGAQKCARVKHAATVYRKVMARRPPTQPKACPVGNQGALPQRLG